MTPPCRLKGTLAIALVPEAPQPVSQPAGSTDNTCKPLKRAKLWELDDKHHCPVIGTCLPMDELAKVARRFFNLVDLRDEFAMHVKAVGYANSRNTVSEAIQKHLERKYQAQITLFERAKSDHDVLATWQEHYAHGEVGGALWAAITHKVVSAATRQRVLADIHMLSHQIGAGQAAGSRRLAKAEKEAVAARAAQDKQKKHQARNEAKLRLHLLKATTERDRLRSARDEVVRLKERLAMFESGTAMMDMGRKLLNLQAANEELMVTVQRGWALEKTLKVAHEEAQALAHERDQLIAERDALERLLLASELDENTEKDCDGQCSNCDPAMIKQCVLYVGGRSSLLAHYRALAERLGIRLIHHDGGLEESLSRLPDMINGADAVMCPTDYVSHSAYYQLKRQCKRSGKPCLLFKGAGVSGFAVALARLSAGQFSLAGTPVNFV